MDSGTKETWNRKLEKPCWEITHICGRESKGLKRDNVTSTHKEEYHNE